jgi:ferredoxin-thioredoxin reductase catalytic subunit
MELDENSKIEFESLKEKLGAYAEKQGIKFNDNEKVVDGIINALLRNRKFKGDIYCPCRTFTGDKEKDKFIVCPCAYHLEEIKELGHCKCNLFWKK